METEDIIRGLAKMRQRLDENRMSDTDPFSRVLKAAAALEIRNAIDSLMKLCPDQTLAEIRFETVAAVVGEPENTEL
jgi:hypothetical protein